MATRTCPTCGTQYVATVRRCIDCGATLVAATSAPATEAKSTSGPAENEQVGYELPGWGNQLKVALEGMLDREGVPRVWEATVLLVPAEFEEAVDRLIEVVEGSDLSEPDSDEPQVALEIEGLDQDIVDDLEARLLSAAVPHRWSEQGDLLVAEVDEDEVLALIDAAFDAVDGEGDGEADDVDVQQVLSALYVAVDRLVKRPDDGKRIEALLAAAEPIATMSVPYGFEAVAWQDVVGDTEVLVDLLRDDDVDADDGAGEEAEADDGDGNRAGGDDRDDADDPDDTIEEGDDRHDTDTDTDTDAVDERARSLRERLREIV